MRHDWLLVHRRTETDYWWFVNKRLLVRRLIERYAPSKGVLLEAGCGGGLFASEMTQGGWRVIASDLAPDAAAFARSFGVRDALAFDADAGWPLADRAVDLVVMLDMLEHVRDDAAALREAWRVLRPGGTVVLTVPAYAFLFSSWDEYNAHFRRYTAGSLHASARQAGFEVRHITYWNAVSLLPAIALRLKDRLFHVQYQALEFPKVAPWANRLLQVYGRIECAWLRRFRLCAGLSVLAVLHKTEETAA
jgi:SAM-dependent methyltransferase